jgi:hypothetical protein
MSVLTDMLYIVDESVKATGEVVTGFATEVTNLANGYESSHPDSGATQEEIQNAAYFAKSVDDPERFPPLNDEMKNEVAERQASEAIAHNLREALDQNPELSPEEQQLQMEERMQTHLDYQKQLSM